MSWTAWMNLNKEVLAVIKGVKTLDADQGRIARRNARKRVVAALAALRRAMDIEFPGAAKAPAQRRRRTYQERVKAVRRLGWVQLMPGNSGNLVGVIAVEKLPIKHIKDANIASAGSTWTPGWVAHYYPNRTLLAKARKSPQMIQAAKAAIALGSLADLIQRNTIRV